MESWVTPTLWSLSPILTNWRKVAGVAHDVRDVDADAVGEEPDFSGDDGIKFRRGIRRPSFLSADGPQAFGGEDERFGEIAGGIGGLDGVDEAAEFGLAGHEVVADAVEAAAVGDEFVAVAGAHVIDEFFGFGFGAFEAGGSAIVGGLHAGGGVDDDDAGFGLSGFGLDHRPHQREHKGGEDEQLQEQQEVATKALEGRAGAHVGKGFGPEQRGGYFEVGPFLAEDVKRNQRNRQ